MKNKDKKITFAEAWSKTLRAWKIWWEISPGVFLSVLFNSLFKALAPYVTIYLSAQIIGELAGNRNPKQLLHWVILQLACSALLALINGILSRWENYEKASAGHKKGKIFYWKNAAAGLRGHRPAVCVRPVLTDRAE